MHKTGPKEDDMLAAEGRAVEGDCAFNDAFCYGETELLFSGAAVLWRTTGMVQGDEFRSE